MNEETIFGKIKYINEHLSCKNYMDEYSTGFFLKELNNEYIIPRRNLETHVIVFVLEGKLILSYDNYLNREFKTGEMFFVHKSSTIFGHAAEKSKIILFSFNYLLSGCDKMQIENLYSYIREEEYDFKPLEINGQMRKFLDTLELYLNCGANCFHLHDLKHREFFMALRFFYTKKQIATFLYPILSNSFDLKNWVLENYLLYNKLDDLIKASTMSRSVFIKKFKEEFNMSPYQWMIKQLCKRLKMKASEPNTTVKDLMVIADINDYSQFSRFCKREFNCTPREFIDNNQK